MGFFGRDAPKAQDVGAGYKVRFRKKKLWPQLRPIAKVGLPFLGGLAIGYFILYRVSLGRYEDRDRRRGAIQHNSVKKKVAKPFSLEEEYEKMQSQMDLSKWENKRIARPE